MTTHRQRSGPRPNPVRDLAGAIAFLTLIPVGRRLTDGVSPRSVGFYPWVGWILGGAAGGAFALVVRGVGHAPGALSLLAGALVIAGWALVTRFLHWDGLADTADGLWGGSTPERRLEIMRDSHVGSYAVAAIAIVGLVQVAAVSGLMQKGAWWVLVAAPVLGRAAPAAAAWTVSTARKDGLGYAVVGRPTTYDVTVWALGSVALAGLGWLGAPVQPLSWVCMVGLFAAIMVPRVLALPVRGITGDILGASVLIVETVVLVTGAVVA